MSLFSKPSEERLHEITLYVSASLIIGLRLVEVDDFIAELWKVHQAVKKEGYAQVGTSAAFEICVLIR